MKEYTIEFPDNYVKPVLPWGKKWVEALRSGEYEQASDALCEERICGYGYCCLGVLSKIQGRLNEEEGVDLHSEIGKIGQLHSENPVAKIIGANGEFPEGVVVYEVDSQGQPCMVGKKAKLQVKAKSLISCNDALKLGFKQIADIIEAIWECSDKEECTVTTHEIQAHSS